MKRAGIKNTIWITTDVHFTAAHYYDPNKAAFQGFDSFWEFVSGPIHAGASPARDPEKTLGAQAVYQKGSSAPGAPPPDRSDRVQPPDSIE